MSHAARSPTEITSVCNLVRATKRVDEIKLAEARGAGMVVADISNDQAGSRRGSTMRESCTLVHVNRPRVRDA